MDLQLAYTDAKGMVGMGKNLRGGNGGDAVANCWAEPNPVAPGAAYVLHAEGLPTNTPLNVSVTTNGDEEVYPFGMSYDGSEAFDEVAPNTGTVTYKFLGPIRRNTKEYGSCTVTVS